MSAVNNLEQTFLAGAIGAFTAILAPISAFSYAVNVDGAAKGDIIKVPFVSNTSGSSAFDYATGYTANGNGVTGKNITLDTILYQKVDLTDADMTRLSPETLTRLGESAGARLAADVMSASFAKVVTNANFPTSASCLSNELTASAGLVKQTKQCDDASWSLPNRNLILGTAAYGNLTSNPSVATAYAYGSNQPITKGQVPEVFGFSPYKINVPLPTGVNGLVLNPNAILLGMAFHRAYDPKNTVQVDQATGTNGLTIGLRTWYDAGTATQKRVLECLFGAAVGDTNALYQMK